MGARTFNITLVTCDHTTSSISLLHRVANKMICRSCLRATALGRQSLIPKAPTRRSFFTTITPRQAAAAATTSTPADPTPAGDATASEETPPRSSCPAGTVLNGLNYFKGKTDPVALPDHEYPEWLWTCLDVQKKTAAEEDEAAGDEFCTFLLFPLPLFPFPPLYPLLLLPTPVARLLTTSPLLDSQIQETAKVSCQAAARARGQDPGDRQPRGAGPQDTAAAAVDQPARRRDWQRAGRVDGGGQERGAEEGHEEGEEGQDQGGQLPQVHVKMREETVACGCVIRCSEAYGNRTSDRVVGVLCQIYVYYCLYGEASSQLHNYYPFTMVHIVHMCSQRDLAVAFAFAPVAQQLQ